MSYHSQYCLFWLLEKSGAWGGTERKLRTFAEAGWNGRKLKGKGIPQCPINPSTEQWRPEDPKFKGILGYLSTPPHTDTHTQATKGGSFGL